MTVEGEIDRQQAPVGSNRDGATSHVWRGVMNRMLGEGYLFDFFQAAWLLENLLYDGKPPGESSDLSAERIVFRPHSGLAFPATDVKAIELLETEPPRARITVTFQGLYGVDSPLPVYFYDSIATEADRTKPLRDFLDIFNHRLYSLFYRSWKKYRPSLYYKPSADDKHSKRMLCLAGLGTRGAVVNAPVLQLQLAGFGSQLSSRVRSTEGLRNLVLGLFEGIGVTIVQNIPRWVPIRNRGKMGKSGDAQMMLGATATIGEKIRDVSGKFRVVLGPLDLSQYKALLPGGVLAKAIHFLVRLYLTDFLDFDVELLLRKGEIPAMRLGDTSVQLGLTSWSGLPEGDLTSRVVAYEVP